MKPEELQAEEGIHARGVSGPRGHEDLVRKSTGFETMQVWCSIPSFTTVLLGAIGTIACWNLLPWALVAFSFLSNGFDDACTPGLLQRLARDHMLHCGARWVVSVSAVHGMLESTQSCMH